MDEAVAKLEKLAYSEGLEPEHISSLMQVILGRCIRSKLLHIIRICIYKFVKSHDRHMCIPELDLMWSLWSFISGWYQYKEHICSHAQLCRTAVFQCKDIVSYVFKMVRHIVQKSVGHM